VLLSETCCGVKGSVALTVELIFSDNLSLLVEILQNSTREGFMLRKLSSFTLNVPEHSIELS